MSTNQPRVVILNRSYWPDTEATGQLLEDLCAHLTKSFDVHLISGKPNLLPDTATKPLCQLH
jgi:colanic acid biosynthesis glycosyl transferase WcaI